MTLQTQKITPYMLFCYKKKDMWDIGAHKCLFLMLYIFTVQLDKEFAAGFSEDLVTE